MSCVTPADLGKPITAIVERCGAPSAVMSLSTINQLMYADADSGQVVTVWFDADQMRARVLQFSTSPAGPSLPEPDWTVTLPFESGAREIALGGMTLADAQGALATDADVTTKAGAAFRSTAQNDDIVLAASDDHVLRTAFVGERASLVQAGLIASPLGTAPFDYLSPVPRDAWLRPSPKPPSGPHSTIFRIDVDAEGIARKVAVVTPSGDATFDAATQQRIGDAKFRPATLNERPVSGACFVQVRH
jgi:Gram-negative bacterial TonB protein C-terminal